MYGFTSGLSQTSEPCLRWRYMSIVVNFYLFNLYESHSTLNLQGKVGKLSLNSYESHMSH